MERLALQELTLDDVDNLPLIFSDPIAMRYYPSTKSCEQTVEWIRWNLTNYRKHGCGLWGLIGRDTQECIGECGIVLQIIDRQPESEIGYHVRRELWGNGYATEAALACRDFGFDKLHKERLVSWIHPENRQSIRVAEKIGMKLDRETTDKHGRRHFFIQLCIRNSYKEEATMLTVVSSLYKAIEPYNFSEKSNQ